MLSESKLEVDTGFLHTKDFIIKYVESFIKRTKAFSGAGCQQSTLRNKVLYCKFLVLKLKGFCSHIVKPNLNANTLVIEMSDDIKSSVGHNIPLLMIDLRGCSDLTPEIINISLVGYSKTIKNMEKLNSHLTAKTFNMSQSYTISTTATIERNIPFQDKYTKLVITISNTDMLLQSVVTGLTSTVHCQDLSTVYEVFRPLGKGAVNQQSVSNSMNQQQSFTSHGDCRDTGGSVGRANEHTERKQEDMLQCSAATESKNQPLQIKPEGYHMSVSNDDVHLEDTVERDGQSPLLSKNKGVNANMLPSNLKQNVAKKDGNLSMVRVLKLVIRV